MVLDVCVCPRECGYPAMAVCVSGSGLMLVAPPRRYVRSADMTDKLIMYIAAMTLNLGQFNVRPQPHSLAPATLASAESDRAPVAHPSSGGPLEHAMGCRWTLHPLLQS